jgi:hypothetical protein
LTSAEKAEVMMFIGVTCARRGLSGTARATVGLGDQGTH